ncbi:MAG TPA: SDR family oxidoreductase [Negativicutes bacterium]|nr:SDR family oxidoreductase [Negativicutes bacterium]
MAKKVLITGGNKGIGHYLTGKFLESSDSVIVVARDFTGFAYAGNERVRAIPYDLSNVDGIPDLVKEIGEIDILINNAGIATGNYPETYTREAAEYIVNLNLASPIKLISEYVPLFIERGYGRVVNITSQAGVFGHYDVWYGATKAGLINATKSFASLYGKKGLVINSVAPGPVDVDVIRRSPKQDRFEKVKQRTILKRFAKPEEVADVVYWLAQESPEYLNGDNYLINNGTTSLDV